MSGAHVPGCTGKPKYGDEATALSATRRGNDRKWAADGRKKEPLYAYACPHCHFWHLSRMSPEAAARGIAVAVSRRENNERVRQEIHERMRGGGR